MAEDDRDERRPSLTSPSFSRRERGFATLKASPGLFIALAGVVGALVSESSGGDSKESGDDGHSSFGWEAVMVLLTNLIISYAAGCATKKEDYIRAFHTRKAPAICVVTQFGLRALFAFLVCKVLDVPNRDAIGIMLCSMAPGGNGSNLFELLFGGDIELGIVCTVTSTIFAIGGIPLNFWLYVGQFESVAFTMPWGEIFMTLSTVVLGAALGSTTRHVSDRWGAKAEEIFVSLGGILLVIAVAAAIAKDFSVLISISWRTWLASVFVTPFSFACGYFPCRLVGLTVRQARTVSIEIGECNIGIAYAMNLLVWSEENARRKVFQGVISYTVFNGAFLCCLTSVWVKEALEQGVVSPPPFLPARVRALFPHPTEDARSAEEGDEKTPDEPADELAVELDAIDAETNGADGGDDAKTARR